MTSLYGYFIEKRHRILLFFILILSAYLMLSGIRWGLPNKNCFVSYKSDENIYIRAIGQMDISKLDFNPHFFIWGSWHFYELALVSAITVLFNFIKLPIEKAYFYFHPEELAKLFLAGRLLSVFFSLSTISLVYLISKRFFNKNIGLLSAFILAIMPAFVISSHFLKADASLTFWAALLLLFAFRILTSDSMINYILAGIVAGFAFGCQYSGVLFLPSIFFAHLLKELAVIPKKTFFQMFFDKKLILAYFFTILFFFISSPYIALSFSEFKSAIAIMLSRGYITAVEHRPTFFLSSFKIFSAGMTMPYVVLALASFVFVIFRKRKKEILILLWLLPCAIAMFTTGTLGLRFQMVIFPGLCVCISIFLLEVFRLFKKKKLMYARILFIFLLISASIYAILYGVAFDRLFASRPVQDEATDWLINNVAKGTEIGIVERPYIENVPTIIHQDYYYKDDGFWVPTFSIINLENDIGKLMEELPEYFVIGERQGFPGELKMTFGAEPSKFVSAMLNKYQVVKHFLKYPRILNIEFKPYPKQFSDWEGIYFSIYILQKMK